MTSTSIISTPIPNGLSPEALIAILHNHPFYLKVTNPDLTSFNMSSGPSPPTIGVPCVYAVTSKSPQGEHTVDQELVNHPEGADTRVTIKLPVGGMMTIQAKWRVNGGVLKEEVELEAGYLMRKMAKRPIEKIAMEQHKTFFEEAGKA
jgi:hypothetical protein